MNLNVENYVSRFISVAQKFSSQNDLQLFKDFWVYSVFTSIFKLKNELMTSYNFLKYLWIGNLH